MFSSPLGLPLQVAMSLLAISAAKQQVDRQCY